MRDIADNTTRYYRTGQIVVSYMIKKDRQGEVMKMVNEILQPKLRCLLDVPMVM